LPPLAPWVVRQAVTPADQVEALLVEAMDKRGYRRFAVLHPEDTFGTTMRDAFWSAAVRRGGEIVAVESYAPGSTDFRRPIRAMVGADSFTPEEIRARQAANQPLAHLQFDAIFIPDGARTAGQVLPQLIYYDVRGPVFMGPSTWNDPSLLQFGRQYADGTLFLDWFLPDADDDYARQFVERYHRAFGEARPLALTAQAYEAAQMLLPTLGEPDRLRVREGLYGRQWDSFSGRAAVRSDGEVARNFYLLSVRNRQIIPLKDRAE
jgi:branched-chain amino acid transport system substrate-binding protein